MPYTGIFALYFVIAVGFAATFTTGQNQLTLFIVAGCAALANLLTAVTVSNRTPRPCRPTNERQGNESDDLTL